MVAACWPHRHGAGRHHLHLRRADHAAHRAAGRENQADARGAAISSEFRSGLWTKDIVKSEGMTGSVTVALLQCARGAAGRHAENVKLYEFDTDCACAA
jgi:hypothetical protein